MGTQRRPARRVADVEQQWGRPIAGILTELYVIRGLTIRQAATALGMSRGRVHQLLQAYGIPRRQWGYLPQRTEASNADH
jgi:hypothetical protein